MKKSAQVTMEFTLVFVIMVALLAGLLTLWKWSSDSIVRRQVLYNQTRLTAGSETPGEPSGEGLWEGEEEEGRPALADEAIYYFE